MVFIFKRKALKPIVHKKRGPNIRESILKIQTAKNSLIWSHYLYTSFNLLKLGKKSKKIRKKVEYMNTVQCKQCFNVVPIENQSFQTLFTF